MKYICISIDFEKLWGLHDVFGLEYNNYYKSILEVDKIVLKILSIFEENKIHATWATVGALAMDSWEEYYSYDPVKPDYKKNKLIFNDNFKHINQSKKLFFASELISQIIKTNNQELGSHTFSHLYFDEKGIKADDFIRDAMIIEKIFKKKYNCIPKSLVFPRNQINFLDCFSRTSLKTFRNHDDKFVFNSNGFKFENYNRLARLVDDLNIFSNNSKKFKNNYSYSKMFIRFNLNKYLWNVQMLRLKFLIKNLNDDEIIHIWWHPHNLGFDFELCLKRLLELINILRNAIEDGDVESKNMIELYQKFKK